MAASRLADAGSFLASGPNNPHPRKSSCVVQGVLTEVVLCEYQDRVAVFVSQEARLGTVILVTRHNSRGAPAGAAAFEVAALSASRLDAPGLSDDEARSSRGHWRGEGDTNSDEAGAGLPDQTARDVFSVSVLMGKRDEPLLLACARSIAQGLSSKLKGRPLVLSLGLGDLSEEKLDTYREISQLVCKAVGNL